jgi:oligopeptide/dipeptide ABC transporter ATP-binding protein
MTADTGQSATASADVLTVEDLRIVYRIRHRGLAKHEELTAVNGVSLTVPRGETVGLVGESGCGKTTLVRAILRLEPATEGRIVLDGEDITALGNRQMRSRRPKVQVVFQDPYSSLDPHMTVHDIVAEPLRINRQYSAQRVAELLESVGIHADMRNRRAATFSGGQQQRIAIARALALRPQLLILDEPVSALDVSIRAQVINLLARLQRELGLSYLFIAHDLSVVHHMSQHVAVMYFGKIVESGTRDQIFRSPRHPYTKLLLSSVPIPTPDGREQRRATSQGEMPDPLDPPPGCSFRRRCPRAQQLCADQAPELREQEAPGHLASCWFPVPAADPRAADCGPGHRTAGLTDLAGEAEAPSC